MSTDSSAAPSGATWLAGRLVRADRVTPTGRVLELDVPGWPGNLPGQHLDLRLTAPDGYQAVRSYSIASHGSGTRVELAVDELPDGEVSPYLVEDMQPGDELELRGPIGGYFVWPVQSAEPVQLIAGGSGIVPLVAMARAHRAVASRARMQLLYSVRAAEDAFYATELAGLVDDFFVLDWQYTRVAPEGWPHAAARVDAAAIMRATIAPADRPLIFVCGPTGFVEAVARLLVAAGHDPARIRTERFGGG